MGGAIVSGGEGPDNLGPDNVGPYAPPSGSRHQQGAGWWQASDGLFYPPEAHPNYFALQAEAAAEAARADQAAREASRRSEHWMSLGRFGPLRLIASFVAVVAVVVLRITGFTATTPPTSTPTISVPTSEELADALESLGRMGGPSTENGGVYADTPVAADDGVVVFTDDFTDPSSGWPVTTSAGGATMAYGPGGYVMTTPTEEPASAAAPINPNYVDEMMTVTGTIAGPTPNESSFGAQCGQTAPDRAVFYQFAIEGDGHWSVVRLEADTPDATEFERTRLDEGNFSPAPTGPVTVRLMCSRLNYDETRLVTFVGDQNVSDLIDHATLPTRNWLTGVVAAGDAATITISSYEEKDLGVR